MFNLTKLIGIIFTDSLVSRPPHSQFDIKAYEYRKLLVRKLFIDYMKHSYLNLSNVPRRKTPINRCLPNTCKTTVLVLSATD
ncbi:uncharacterized protein PHALS_15291 [Plasmopara halstedii]|uniref:Uncharacterized protein n=1 Tax=Plasmopara halstedii TaxID=4781 RepID=A0A0N7L4A5_PLAHL|nr:uncharacterized protein PHALS_15291 [Plasmopara halstedii]CEG38131.1 hypothetical protein PHALS_15291 [Plasmopara halstedii]|eukprot:XP_024574500.1 hypothetical protein PHALS_15291 [Plasmopara halstedii]